MRIAILDDYQSVALTLADWGRLKGKAEVVSFADHVKSDDALVARLSAFDAVCRMRERTAFPRAILERLPRLKLILATGLRNARSIDLKAAHELGITVCSTESHSFPTVELTWAMILSLFRKVHIEAASVRAGGWQLVLGEAVRGKTLGAGWHVPAYVTLRGCEGAKITGTIGFAGGGGTIEGFDIAGSVVATKTGSYVVRYNRFTAGALDEAGVSARSMDAVEAASITLVVESSSFESRTSMGSEIFATTSTSCSSRARRIIRPTMKRETPSSSAISTVERPCSRCCSAA